MSAGSLSSTKLELVHGSTSGIKPQFMTCFHLVCREEQHRLGKVVPAPAMQLPMPLAHLPAKQARKRQHPKVVVCTECLGVSSRIHAHCKATMKHYSQFFARDNAFCVMSSSRLYQLYLFNIVWLVTACASFPKSMQLQCTSKSMQLPVNATPMQL